MQASLPLWKGGLGLRSAVRTTPAACLASWLDSLKMIQQRHPKIADTILQALDEEHGCSIQTLLRCTNILRDAGMEVPTWTDVAAGRVEGESREDDPCQPRVGWQKQAAQSVEVKFFEEEVWPSLQEDERAMVWSRTGPMASTPLISFPVDRNTRFDSQPFRLLVLRRLCLPLPLSFRRCQCGRPVDVLGHHRAACGEAGVLGRRGWPLESVAARICREAGARVRTNVYVRDMDLATRRTLDGRGLEVGGRWPATFRWSTAGHRHNDGITLPQRWHCPARSSTEERGCVDGGPREQGADLPRACWGRRPSQTCGLGH